MTCTNSIYAQIQNENFLLPNLGGGGAHCLELNRTSNYRLKLLYLIQQICLVKTTHAVNILAVGIEFPLLPRPPYLYSSTYNSRLLIIQSYSTLVRVVFFWPSYTLKL